MNNKFYKRISVIAAVLLLMFFVAASMTSAQEQPDDALKKKYAPILSEYEFDLTSMGGNVEVLNYYIQDGKLWADSGDGEPAVMEPMEEEGFAFEAISSDGQTFEIRFSKDDQGNYSTCKILIVEMGLEVEGTKIK